MTTRRNLLRGASAVLGAAALGPLRSQGLQADSDTAAKRFIFIGSASGCVPNRFWPMGDRTFNYSTAPLERHSENVSFLRGVSMTNGGDHKPYVMVTGQREPGGASIDQLIAERMRSSLGYDQPSLVLCGKSKNQNLRGWFSFGRDGERVLPQSSPLDAFSTVFGRGPMADGGAAATPARGGRAALNRAILGTVTSDIESLTTRVAGSSADRLAEHGDAVARLAASFEDGESAPGPVEGAGCGTGEEGFTTASSGYLDDCRRHMDLIALSFACDRRRVANFMMTPLGHDNMGRGNYRGMGYEGALPGLSSGDQVSMDGPGDLHQVVAHAWHSNSSYAETFARMHRAEAAVIAYLIDRLKAIPDASGEGTVFDHTVLYWTNEHADPNHGVNAGRSDFPTMVAAGRCTGVRVGSYVDLDGGNEVHGAILLALAQQVGAPLDRFGTFRSPWREILV